MDLDLNQLENLKKKDDKKMNEQTKFGEINFDKIFHKGPVFRRLEKYNKDTQLSMLLAIIDVIMENKDKQFEIIRIYIDTCITSLSKMHEKRINND